MTRNWAGTYDYTAPRIVAAWSEADVIRAVAGDGPVHALGTRHSFTDLPDTSGTLIDLAGLEGGFALRDGEVRVAAGTRYGVLATWLDERGLALHNLGSLPHISVAGATATGTHGSGDANGVLTTAVRGIRFVDADGEVREVRSGDPDFAALAVGVGAYGVVVSLDIETRPSYRMRQDVYRDVSWDAALGALDTVTGAGYSVSVFTRWEPRTVGFVWVKSRLDADDDPVPDALLDGVLDIDAEPLGGLADVTRLRGEPGPWMLRLPHFRLDGTPSFGDEIQSEYFVPRSAAPAALRAMLALGDVIRPLLFVSELRTASADELWLSPAFGQDVLAIHFTWHNDPVGVAAVLPRIEEALAPFGARPHWGKRHAFDRAAIERVHPRLSDARAVFERIDPRGRFVNAHLERVGLREQR
ncbi:D-arabinono-1,4-lactone oxidase [Microbacterium sp. CFBP9034]|uniref:D-arabinono-1,4-lactone oxidase n=1 Tax=Microbacterium sp. CFBP9034 TaxID=3096540 RepID=UPI002A6B2ECD|nr:D-arabinono-1,4-lactone oxidase [Microbacterium sp. CFBP9034]MDY0908410.1 FAD-binding protein [Microbacterium sp. CFBP9034]